MLIYKNLLIFPYQFASQCSYTNREIHQSAETWNFIYWVGTNCHPPSIQIAGGKQKLNCANAKGLLRIIQSIASPKAEPFKLWLAQVGSDRLDEIENPELATQRTSHSKGEFRLSGKKEYRQIDL